MPKKPIPNGHSDFASAARTFAITIAREPARFAVSQEDCDALSAAVNDYCDALQRAGSGSRGTGEAGKIMRANRKQVESIWRSMRHAIRASNRVDAVSKEILNLAPAKRGAKQLSCPQEPPYLTFVRAMHEGNAACPMHELAFKSLDCTQSKPEGAVRLELFMDLIGMDEELPAHPGQHHAGHPWYLRSYSKSPIVIQPPMPRLPMIMLYWARWADAMGNVGPFCKTVRSTMPVGGMGRFLGVQLRDEHKPMPMFEDMSGAHDVTIRVAVLEVQRQAMMPTTSVDAKRLAGPEAEAA